MAHNHWKFWIFSGVTGHYIDIDYNFWILRGFLHVRYGNDRGQVCTNPAHS